MEFQPLSILYLSLCMKDPLHHMTDQELLARYYEEHNNEWLGSLLQRYTLLLFGVCMKYMR